MTTDFVWALQNYYFCIVYSVSVFASSEVKVEAEAEINFHLQFLAEDFIGYLEEWRAEVMAREGFTKTEKNKMFLTQQTGVKTTGKFIDSFWMLLVKLFVRSYWMTSINSDIDILHIIITLNVLLQSTLWSRLLGLCYSLGSSLFLATDSAKTPLNHISDDTDAWAYELKTHHSGHMGNLSLFLFSTEKKQTNKENYKLMITFKQKHL